jgi:DNA-binding transcriptional ArsR family regulator
MKEIEHPPRAHFSLAAVLDGLSDPTRLAIVSHLAERGECMCRDFLSLGSKTNLSYHLAKLRESGIVRVRLSGVYRYMDIRWDDLEARFPGLMQSLLATAKKEGAALPKVTALPAVKPPPKTRIAKGASARK